MQEKSWILVGRILVGFFVIGLFGLHLGVRELQAAGERRTALDEYVAKPDPNYRYELLKTIKEEGYTAYILEMVSQSWRSPQEVEPNVWRHWMTITVPDDVDSTTGLLIIGGGSNDGDPPEEPGYAGIAIKTKSVVALLKMVPNQPLKFPDEPMDKYKEKGRWEDAMIAYTWDKYLKTGDELWPARLPMVKSAVRAMDTVTSFCKSEECGNITVDRFVVAGGSKRGWTTWMTAAVDDRVVAIVPIVIDLLNVIESMKHHYRAYGFWAPAISDYEEMGIMEYIDDPRFEKLADLVEPYEYRSRLTMPKFLINASGDQFFLPDSSQFYFDDLPGRKYLRYVPNADHGLDETDALESLVAFYDSVMYDKKLPDFSWDLVGDDSIRVNTADKPTEVKLWQATNPDTRDFRLETIGKVWKETALSAESNGVYVGKVESPEKGWTAFFVELTFETEAVAPLKFTTEVQVVPETLPYTFPPESK